MSPNDGASPDRPDEPGKKYLSVTVQPSSMVVVRCFSLELDPSWRLMFIEYVEAQAPQGLVSEITVGTGFAYVTCSGYGEQAKRNKQQVLELINDIVPLITPDTVTSWIEQGAAKPVHA